MLSPLNYLSDVWEGHYKFISSLTSILKLKGSEVSRGYKYCVRLSCTRITRHLAHKVACRLCPGIGVFWQIASKNVWISRLTLFILKLMHSLWREVAAVTCACCFPEVVCLTRLTTWGGSGPLPRLLLTALWSTVPGSWPDWGSRAV